MFIHLRAHSNYSFLEGLSSPGELAQAAAKADMPGVALTDHNSLTGAIEFYDACRQVGLQPIIGLELEVDQATGIADRDGLGADRPGGGLLALLALDMTGWANLCRLSSLAMAEAGSPGASLSFTELAKNSDGLLCLTGGRRGAIAGLLRANQERPAVLALERLDELFPGRLYAELQAHTADDAGWSDRLAELAGRLKIPLVATHNAHYVSPEQAGLQRLVSAIRQIRPVEALSASDAADPDAYFPSPEEMLRRFGRHSQALDATQEIAGRCRLELPLGIPHFPLLPLPAGQTPLGQLRQKAEAGLRSLYPDVTPAMQARLDHELDVIGACGYATLFLVMEEIITFARRSGVPIASRGSASSSLVAHCLGVTSPDPIGLDLYFERFLNPARATPPDIDTDLCSRRRDEVIHFVYERFGQERVAMVCTINRFRRRSALRETAKAHGLAPAEVNALAEALPERWYGPPERFTAAQEPFASLSERYPAPRYQAIFREAAALIGLPRHLSIHPGGIVIAPSPITDLAPTQMAAKGVVITQFDLDSIERLGLVKIDLLGIRGLTVLGDVAEAVASGQLSVHSSQLSVNSGQLSGSGSQPMSEGRSTVSTGVLEAIPEDDPATSELVRQGRTIGCFQIESPGMRATLKEIQAGSVGDLMVALALYRPGPLTGGLKDAFVRRHRGQEAPTYLHPALQALLSDTYGVILYQEQVLRIAHGLAGLSLSDADLLRRAMSHFDPGKQMQTLKAKFIAGAAEQAGVPPAVAERVWEQMAAFAGYGFPKAHAASYAQVAWRSAWCKAHFPATFMAAVLANWGGYYSQRVYLTEARRLGLRLRPPNVNHAHSQFIAEFLDNQPVLYMGLDQVRELTRRTQARILKERPFRSLEDFLSRTDPRPVEAENLIRVGALDDFGNIPTLLSSLQGAGRRAGQLSLFPIEAQPLQDWSLEEKVAAQEAILGAGLVAHPLELAGSKIAASGALTTIEAAEHPGRSVRVAGMRQTWRRSATSRGDYIYFMALEDLEGMLDVIIFSDVYRRCRKEMTGAGPFLVEGVVEIDQQTAEHVIRAEKISNLLV